MIGFSFIIVVVVLFFSDDILVAAGQDPTVSKFSSTYLFCYMPGLLFYGLSDLNRKFLNSFKKNFIPMLSFATSVMLHPIWVQYFVIECDLSIVGIAIAGCITNLITYTIIKIFISKQKDLKESEIPFFDSRTFESEGLVEYFWLGAPYMLINFLDYFMWELMTLSSGMIGINEQASQVILINILCFCYMFGSGMQTTTCTIIGN